MNATKTKAQINDSQTRINILHLSPAIPRTAAGKVERSISQYPNASQIF